MRTFIDRYLEHTKDYEAPEVSHLLAALWALGAAVERRVYLKAGHLEWPVNLFILLIAPPGVAQKSTTIGHAQKLLRQIGVPDGVSVTTIESLIQDMVDMKKTPVQEVWEEQERDVYARGDHATSLPPDYTYTWCSLAVSEFGAFARPQEQASVDILTDLWDGTQRTWTKGTITRGKNELETPVLHYFAATTPTWFKTQITPAMLEGGFISRHLIGILDGKRHYCAYPGLDQIQKNQKLEENLISHLEMVSELKGLFVMSPEFRAEGERWYISTQKNRYQSNTDDPLHALRAGVMVRDQAQMHKLAMLHSLACGDDLVLKRRDFEFGLDLVTRLYNGVLELLHQTEGPPEYQQTHDILQFMTNYPLGVSEDRLLTAMRPKMQTRDMDAAIESLLRSKDVTVIETAFGRSFRLTKT
jgi:hypothetical protein